MCFFLFSGKSTGSGVLSTLSTLFGLLQLLLPSSDTDRKDQDDMPENMIYPSSNRTVNVSIAEMKALLKLNISFGDNPIGKLEKLLEVSFDPY